MKAWSTKALSEWFWLHVKKVHGGCWEWTGACSHNGYGTLSTSYPERRAHRYVWLTQHGPIPRGMLVLHKCDNRRCVNPSHLFLGTAKDNTRDMQAKGRLYAPGPKTPLTGESGPMSKLTRADVLQIRSSYRPYVKGMTESLAKQFGVSKAEILNVATGKRWAHISMTEVAQ